VIDIVKVVAIILVSAIAGRAARWLYGQALRVFVVWGTRWIVRRMEKDVLGASGLVARMKAFSASIDATNSREHAAALTRQMLPGLASDLGHAVRMARALELDSFKPLAAQHQVMLAWLERNPQPKIVTPPFARVSRVLLRILPAPTYERVISPLLADLVREWCEAEIAGRRAEAARIKWLWAPWHVGTHLFALVPRSLLGLAARLLRKLFAE
jgi:hypothetical protein